MDSIAYIARAWIGTPYHQEAQEKMVGVDCAGLILGTLSEINININRNADLISTLHYYCNKQSINNLKADDIILFNQMDAIHLAICADYKYNGLSMIHACLKNQQVIEHRLTSNLINKIASVWRINVALLRG